MANLQTFGDYIFSRKNKPFNLLSQGPGRLSKELVSRVQTEEFHSHIPMGGGCGLLWWMLRSWLFVTQIVILLMAEIRLTS